MYLEKGILSFSSYWSLVLINFGDNSWSINSCDLQEHSAEEARTFCSCFNQEKVNQEKVLCWSKMSTKWPESLWCLKESELWRSVILSQEALTDYFIFQLRWLSLSLADWGLNVGKQHGRSWEVGHPARSYMGCHSNRPWHFIQSDMDSVCDVRESRAYKLGQRPSIASLFFPLSCGEWWLCHGWTILWQLWGRPGQ